MRRFSHTDAPWTVLGVHSDRGSSGGIRHGLHVRNGGYRIAGFGSRRDENRVWLKERYVCDTRSICPSLSPLSVIPCSVNAFPCQGMDTSGRASLYTRAELADSMIRILKHGCTESKNRFEFFPWSCDVLLLRFRNANDRGHTKTEGELVVERPCRG